MVDNTTKSPCTDQCHGAITERNRYYTGKYMTARDFAADQEYFLSRSRLQNRLLHGWGIVCGLRVLPHPNADCRENWVVIKSGVALDCSGREIFVHKDTALEIPLDDLPDPGDNSDPGSGTSVAFNSSSAWPQDDDDDYDDDDDELARDADSASSEHVTAEEYAQWPEDGLLVCLRYTEQRIETVPALYAEGQCDSSRMEANRIREVGTLEIHRLSDMREDCWRAPGGGWNVPFVDDCDQPLPGPGGTCLDADCPCHGCVPLALLVRKRHRKAGEPGFEIDLRGRRRLPTPSHYLTHIMGINWPHGGEVTLRQLHRYMDGGLKIRFNRRIIDAGDMGAGINPYTFQVQYGGVQKVLEFLPSASQDDPYLMDDGCTAVYNLHPDYISPRHRSNIVGSIVYITLKCDFILDCHDLPVDGEHLAGRLPSGNGSPGGIFHSWFSVVHSQRRGQDK